MAVRLTDLVTSCGGCAAKWSGGGLEGFLETLAATTTDVMICCRPRPV